MLKISQCSTTQKDFNLQKTFSVDVSKDNVKKYNLELRSDSLPLNLFKNEEIYSGNLKMNLIRNKHCGQPKYLERIDKTQGENNPKNNVIYNTLIKANIVRNSLYKSFQAKPHKIFKNVQSQDIFPGHFFQEPKKCRKNKSGRQRERERERERESNKKIL